MKHLIRTIMVLALLAFSLTAYSAVARHVGFGPPPKMAPPDQQADAIFVDKSDHHLALLRDGKVIKEYRASFGGDPKGHKAREGDQKTPVGDYRIDWRNPGSIAHLSLHISYPNDQDVAQAAARGVSPGGDIMIHGILNGWGFLGPLQRYWNWTNGCIAVTDAEIREIWSLVPDGTPITIQD